MSSSLKPNLQQVGRVVAQPEIELGIRSRGGAGALVVVVEHARQLGRDQRARAERSRAKRVCSTGDEVGVRAERALGAEIEHLRPERRDAAVVARQRRPARRRGRRGTRASSTAAAAYSPVASGWPMPMPTSSRPGKARASSACSAASSAGSYCQTLTMPVATVSCSVASSSGRTVGSRGEPPSQNAPKPSSRPGGGLAGVLLPDRPVGGPDSDLAQLHGNSVSYRSGKRCLGGARRRTVATADRLAGAPAYSLDSGREANARRAAAATPNRCIASLRWIRAGDPAPAAAASVTASVSRSAVSSTIAVT